MRKQICTRTRILLAVFFIAGCSKTTNMNDTDTLETNEQMNISQGESEQLLPERVMDRIAENYGLNNAQDYESRIEDMSKDAIVMLCQSESGKYTAYGFISPEYGQTGILIDNIINSESNWNYWGEATWTYSDSKPMISEQGEYNVIFTYTQGNGLEKTVYFDTFDTGTMSIKE